MQTARPSLFARNDTLLGICQGLGEDLGFNPLYLRVALASGLLWNPLAMVGIYLALGALVLASRLLFPRRRAERAAPAEQALPLPHNDEAGVDLAKAA